MLFFEDVDELIYLFNFGMVSLSNHKTSSLQEFKQLHIIKGKSHMRHFDGNICIREDTVLLLSYFLYLLYVFFFENVNKVGVLLIWLSFKEVIPHSLRDNTLNCEVSCCHCINIPHFIVKFGSFKQIVNSTKEYETDEDAKTSNN